MTDHRLLVDPAGRGPRTGRPGEGPRFSILDAPVSGGEAGAIAGTLSILVGGANGDGGLDHSALLRGVLRLSGQNPDGDQK